MAPLRRAGGFTLVELVVIVILLGILAVAVLPRFSRGELAAGVFQDEVAAALRFAQKTAVSHRRLVCARVTATTVGLTIATANPASSCPGANVVAGPEGAAAFARSRDPAVANVAGLALNGGALALPATLYFQPSGLVTADGGGGRGDRFEFSMANAGSLVVEGATGHVR